MSMLRRILAALLAGFCTGALCRAGDPAPAIGGTPEEAIPAYQTPPIKVDGALDEPVWQTARRIPVKYVNGQKDRVAKDASGEFMLAWDEHYLYVAYRYASSIPPISYKTERQVGPPGNQRPQLAIGGDMLAGQPRPHIFELNVDLGSDGFYVWELHHSAQDYWLPKLCIRPRDAKDPLWNLIGSRGCPVLFMEAISPKDDGAHKLKTAVREMRDEAGGTNRYAGYTTEWALPLAGLGAPLDRRGSDGAYRLDGHRFRAFGGEWRMDGSEAAFYHSVPGSDKQWFVDTLLCGHVFEFKPAARSAVADADLPTWSQWRGPEGSGISSETGWNPATLADGAKVVWRTNVGSGYSSVVIRKGLLYTMGSQTNQEIVRCLKARTGEEVWKYTYDCKSVPTPGARVTPTVDGDSLYTMSGRGLVLCLDARNGTVKWQRDVVAEKQSQMPFYGFSGSPVVDGDLLLVNAGRCGIALNKQTGKTVWASEPELGGYATPVVRVMAGRRVAVIFGQKALYAVDVQNGERQWAYPWDTGFDSNAADPIIAGQKVFVSSCYAKGNVNGDKGCALLDVTTGEPKPVWTNLSMRSHFSSAVVLAGHVYGFDGRAGNSKTALKCIDLETGEERWSHVLGFGSLMAVGGKLIVLTEQGCLLIVEATPAGYRELSKADNLLSKKCWTVPVLCGGRIYCRNEQGDLVCVDVSR